MRACNSFLACSAATALALAAAGPAAAAVNILPTAVASTTVSGVDGVLRDATWSAGSTPSDELAVYDDVFEPENQQWNNGSFWWDELASVNNGPVTLTLNLSGLFTIASLVIQADDNDGYLVEYWNGATWQTAASFAAVNTFGLVTRPTAVLGAPITTDALRLSAFGGDSWYGVSELQAFGVPEPATWALMIGGFGLAGATLRGRRRVAAL